MPLVTIRDLNEIMSRKSNPLFAQPAEMAALEQLTFAIIPCRVVGDRQHLLGIPLWRWSDTSSSFAGYQSLRALQAITTYSV
jgi:hypothetical protein